MPAGNPRNPSGAMQTGADPINFGVLPALGGTNAYFSITNARSNALLTATITNDDSHGRFSVRSLKSYTSAPVSGGPPHTPSGSPGVTLIETDSTDGTRPLHVSRRQTILIELGFYDRLTDARDSYEATLVITDQGPSHWAPISANMIAVVASIITTELPAPVELTQGQTKRVGITIVSNAGPDTTVSYTLQVYPPGVFMAPLNNVPLPSGGRVNRNLDFAATTDAQLGVSELTLLSKDKRGTGQIYEGRIRLRPRTPPQPSNRNWLPIVSSRMEALRSSACLIATFKLESMRRNSYASSSSIPIRKSARLKKTSASIHV
jgi:hypothetical protein